jgi:hypothetical protein
MKLKLIFHSLLFVAIFLSCKKEEPLITVNSKTNGTLLSKVLIDKQPYYEYSYNIAGLIADEKSKYDFTKHNYNDRNQLVSTDYYSNFDILSSDLLIYQAAISRKEWVTPLNGTKGGTNKYEYNSIGQLIKTTYSRSLSTSSEYSEFNYDVNNRISRQILYWENKETGYTDYLYDSKGNLIKETLYNMPLTGADELSTTIQYEFDNQQNPYESFIGLLTPGINTNHNNIIKETYTIHLSANLGPVKVQVTENSYLYNAKGYPISKNKNVEYVY